VFRWFWALLHRYRQVLGGMGYVKNFSARGVREGQGPLMQILDPNIISETIGAKVEIKTQLDVVKYWLRVQ